MTKSKKPLFAFFGTPRFATQVLDALERNGLLPALIVTAPDKARGRGLFDGKLDPFSSAVFFPGWKERTVPEIHIPPEYDPPRVCSPQTWLLRSGWKLAAPISCAEVPGVRKIARRSLP